MCQLLSGTDPGFWKGGGLIVHKYSGCILLAIIGVVFSPMNCNRDNIPTYSANLHNKTGEKLIFLIASTFMNLSNLKI